MRKKKLVVYIAGPFTAPNAWERELNVRRAEEMALEVAKLGAMPLCPHTNTRFFDGTLTPDFWYDGTLELMFRCDAVIQLPNSGSSKGTRREVVEAGRNDIPVFTSLHDLGSWILRTTQKSDEYR